MKALMTCMLICACFVSQGFQERVFTTGQDRMKVYEGDRVTIRVDSAYIVSMAQALLLNEKLFALRVAQEEHAAFLQREHRLMEKVATIEALTVKLLRRMQYDQQLVAGNLLALLTELGQSIASLQQTNEQLKRTNDDLHLQLLQMNETVKHLKQANRKIAWQNTRKLMGAGLLAFGLGLLVGS